MNRSAHLLHSVSLPFRELVVPLVREVALVPVDLLVLVVLMATLDPPELL